MTNDREQAEIPSLGTLIKEARQKKRWTQIQLADKMGVEPKTISRWELEKTKPQRGSRDKLCRILDISPKELEYALTTSSAPEEENSHSDQISTPNEQQVHPTPKPTDPAMNILSTPRTGFIQRKTSILQLVSILLALAILVGGTYFFISTHTNRQFIPPHSNPITAPSGEYPYPTYLPGNGQLRSYDPMTDSSTGLETGANSQQDGYCSFINRNYHVTKRNPGFRFCSANSVYDANFTIEMQVTIVKGDCAGIYIGLNDKIGNAYEFIICQTGLQYLYYYVPDNTFNTLEKGFSPSIHKGPGQSNILDLTVQGSTLTVFANTHKVGQARAASATTTTGNYGAITIDTNRATDAIFNNLIVWTS